MTVEKCQPKITDDFENCQSEEEQLCADCNFWRDYSDPIEIQEHPDYDGHCWLKGIMTLNVKECREHNKNFTVKDGKVEDDRN